MLQSDSVSTALDIGSGAPVAGVLGTTPQIGGQPGDDLRAPSPVIQFAIEGRSPRYSQRVARTRAAATSVLNCASRSP